jgi:hypothetical protein
MLGIADCKASLHLLLLILLVTLVAPVFQPVQHASCPRTHDMSIFAPGNHIGYRSLQKSNVTTSNWHPSITGAR